MEVAAATSLTAAMISSASRQGSPCVQPGGAFLPSITRPQPFPLLSGDAAQTNLRINRYIRIRFPRPAAGKFTGLLEQAIENGTSSRKRNEHEQPMSWEYQKLFTKGIRFYCPDGEDGDVFYHISSVVGDFEPAAGDAVEFTVVERNGRP
jgi:cold shock CspA family protein